MRKVCKARAPLRRDPSASGSYYGRIAPRAYFEIGMAHGPRARRRGGTIKAMLQYHGRYRARRPMRIVLGEVRLACGFLLAAGVIALAACHHISFTDMKPLDDAGMSYDAIEQLRALDITSTEAVEIA